MIPPPVNYKCTHISKERLNVSAHLHFGATYLLESVKNSVSTFYCCQRATLRALIEIVVQQLKVFFEHKIAINLNFIFICLSFRVTCDLFNHHYGYRPNYSYQTYLIDRDVNALPIIMRFINFSASFIRQKVFLISIEFVFLKERTAVKEIHDL